MKPKPAPAISPPKAAPAAPPRETFSAAWFVAAVFLTVLAYAPTFRSGFIWNDSDYVTAPTLQSSAGLARIWADVGATEQYYPVLHTAFWMQHRVWGDAPLGYHITNLVLHLGAAWLFGLALRQLKVKGAWLAASLFALHPVCVESVAWISEQKNTLSTVFFLAAALAYLRFDARRSVAWYALATVLFLGALLSKSLTATLPPALLVVLWWRNGRLSARKDFLPLLPWFVVGAAVGLFTGWVEHTYLGASGGDFELTWPQRVLLAGRVVWFYATKLLWPMGQVFIYPRWQLDPTSAWQYLFPLATLALLTWLALKRHRGVLAGALFFVGSLFPVMGFLSLYGFLFSFVADHWQYLPCLGLIALAGAGIESAVTANWHGARAWGPTLCGALLLSFGALTWRLTLPYESQRALYQDIVDKNPSAWMAHNNLGVQLVAANRPADAIPHYREALRLRPNYFDAENNLGQALDATGDTSQAMLHYQRAVQLNPSYVGAHINLGNVLFNLGRIPEAEREFRHALVLDPASYQATYNLAVILAQRERRNEAVAYYERALRVKPDSAEAHFNLGALLEELRRTDDAIAHYEASLRSEPSADAHNNLGSALLSLGRLDAAAGHFEAALKLNPNLSVAHLNLALALQKLGRGEEARAHAAQARARGARP